MPRISDLKDKIFVCECRGVAPVQLLGAVDQALMGVRTSGQAGPYVQASWDQWQLTGPAKPDNGLVWVNPQGQRVPLSAYAFEAFVNYREQQASVGGNFSCQGTIQLFCSSGSSAEQDYTSLLLGFADNPSMPMWRSYASELVVYETVKAVADTLRRSVFVGHNGPILELTSGGWVNQKFANFPRSL